MEKNKITCAGCRECLISQPTGKECIENRDCPCHYESEKSSNYMLFGFRLYQINPNDYLPDYEDSEADAPWLFKTRDGAEAMAKHINQMAIDEVMDTVTVGEVFFPLFGSKLKK